MSQVVVKLQRAGYGPPPREPVVPDLLAMTAIQVCDKNMSNVAKICSVIMVYMHAGS